MPRVRILNADENPKPTAVSNAVAVIPAAPSFQEELIVSPVDLSKQLLQTLLRLKGKFLDENGNGDEGKRNSRKVDYNKLRETSEFSTFHRETKQLTKVNLAAVPNHNERKAFFLNIYNALTIHALTISVDREHEMIELDEFWRRNAYQIGKLVYSLDDIEHGILRCNKQHPSTNKPLFSHDDPRLQFTQPYLDPRIHFALNCGAKSCPALRLYSANNIEKLLDIATQTFCQNDIVVELKDKRVTLSHLFMWYGGDFGHDQKSILEWIAKFLTEEQARDLQSLIAVEDFNLLYAKYDWIII